jgi:vacuolar-type H+-ATPase subunit I/STV1
MSKRKIYIYISDIASFIGQNKWDYVTPFERLWKKCDSQEYKNTLTHINNNINTKRTVLNQISQDKSVLQQKLTDKLITQRQFTIAKNKLEKEYIKIDTEINNLQDSVDEIDLTQKEKLERVLGTNVIENIESKTIETENKRQTVKTLFDNLDISNDKKEKLKKQADSFINKTHGTLKEDSAIELYEKKFKVKLNTSQKLYSKKLDFISEHSVFDWFICGKMDGLYEDSSNESNNYVIEIKNRTKGFFSTLRDYENTQIQLYLWITTWGKAKLVEKYQNKIRITEIYKDDDCINDIMEYLSIFVNKFENHFLNNQELKTLYISHDNDHKQQFIKRLYLNDIYQAANKKYQSLMDIDIQTNKNNNECEIDDLD